MEGKWRVFYRIFRKRFGYWSENATYAFMFLASCKKIYIISICIYIDLLTESSRRYLHFPLTTLALYNLPLCQLRPIYSVSSITFHFVIFLIKSETVSFLYEKQQLKWIFTFLEQVLALNRLVGFLPCSSAQDTSSNLSTVCPLIDLTQRQTIISSIAVNFPQDSYSDE